jgi:hypothetical protein
MRYSNKKVPFAKVIMDLRVITRYAAADPELNEDIRRYLKTVGWTVEEYLQECAAIKAVENLPKNARIITAGGTFSVPLPDTLPSYKDIN